MRRRGYLLVEVFVACTILAALFALVIQMISVTARERRSTERRAIAMEHAANLLERASAIPFDELSTEALAKVSLPEDAPTLLPESEVHWTVTDVEADLPTKQVQVELKWRQAHARHDAPVRLVTWSFPKSMPAPVSDTPAPEVPAPDAPAPDAHTEPSPAPAAERS